MGQGASQTTPLTGDTKGKHTPAQSDAVPLDASARVHPIHPSIPSIKLPPSTAEVDSVTLNPITLKPFSAEDLQNHNFTALKEQYSTPGEAKKAQEEALRELKERLDENERKTREVEREMDAKEKTRELERKIYMKKLGKGSAT